MAHVDYEAETRTSLLGDFKRDKAKDAAKKKGLRASGSLSMNDEALVRLMVSEMASQNERAIEIRKEERLSFLEIKRKEVECREREIANQELRQRQEDISELSEWLEKAKVAMRWMHEKGISSYNVHGGLKNYTAGSSSKDGFGVVAHEEAVGLDPRNIHLEDLNSCVGGEEATRDADIISSVEPSRDTEHAPNIVQEALKFVTDSNMMNSFEALNKHDKVFEDVDMTKAKNEDKTAIDATKAVDESDSDVVNIYDETAQFMASSHPKDTNVESAKGGSGGGSKSLSKRSKKSYDEDPYHDEMIIKLAT
ncbi:hypothetical protein Tco_1292422 [Tanacetum coccineum]